MSTGVRRFEDLLAWQFSMDLCREVLQITEQGKVTKDEEFCAQIRDAAKSVPALIAEGFLRFTTAEFIRYLRWARGELGEIQSELSVGRAADYFSPEDFDRASKLARRAMGTTTNLLKAKLRQQAVELRAKNLKRRKRPPRP